MENKHLGELGGGNPLPWIGEWRLGSGRTKPGTVWIRVGLQLTTDGIQLKTAMGTAPIAIAKQVT